MFWTRAAVFFVCNKFEDNYYLRSFILKVRALTLSVIFDPVKIIKSNCVKVITFQTAFVKNSIITSLENTALDNSV